MPDTQLDRHTILRLAVLAFADPRTVRKRLRDEPVRGSVALRIDKALRTLREEGMRAPGMAKYENQKGGENPDPGS